ncbi:MAG: Tfp pilus assembly protein FimT/FimU [Phycisphaerales bacterium]
MTHRHAFSLVELIAVMAILGVLSLASIPAVGAMSESRRRGAGAEIERRLMLARAWAASTGQPAGLRVTTSTGQLELLRIAAPGAAPTALPGSTGESDAGSSVLISQLYTGTSIASMSVTPSGDSAVWFAYDGTPQVRTSAGVLVGDLSTDATITVQSGPTITVRVLTGLVER